MNIILTGGIGSGKTEALNYLQQNGYTCLQTDTLAKELLHHPSIQKTIQTLFGHTVFTDQTINLKKFTQALFSNPSAKSQYQKALYPHIDQHILSAIQAHKNLAVEVPMLVEAIEQGCTFHQHFTIIALEAPPQTRIHRIQERDHRPESQIQTIMQQQASDQQRRTIAHHTIINQGTLKELHQKLHEMDKNASPHSTKKQYNTP